MNGVSPTNINNNRSQIATCLVPMERRFIEFLKTTPGVLTTMLIVSIVATIIMTAATYYNYADIRSAVKTVGKDSVPSIIAAEHISAKLADANANAMNAILTGEKDSNGKFWKEYRTEMNQVHDELITAAQNITYEEERQPIYLMMSKLAEYENVLGRTKGKTVSESMNDFVLAHTIMRQNILPEAAKLDQINFQYLDNSYNKHLKDHKILMIGYIIFAVLLLVVLLMIQRYLFQKTKRILNPGLVVATIAFVLFQIYAINMFYTTENNLRVAKKDAFDSVHALWKARAIAYDGNADESLYLLFQGNKIEQAKATIEFKAKAQKITAINPEQALTATKFGGLLGDELSNITFPGEREVAKTALVRWAEYIRIDNKMRELENQGRYQEALDLNIGIKEGQSNFVFDKFDEALGQTLEINQKEFDNKINSALASLNIFPYVLSSTFIIIVVASGMGMKARIDEYRF